MRRDPRACLRDVRDAADAITSFTLGRSLRSAVERQFEIIGDALN